MPRRAAPWESWEEIIKAVIDGSCTSLYLDTSLLPPSIEMSLDNIRNLAEALQNPNSRIRILYAEVQGDDEVVEIANALAHSGIVSLDLPWNNANYG